MPELKTTTLFTDANLVSYWRFESNSNDEKGSNNGTDHATLTYSTGNGKFNKGVGFDGSAGYIDLGDPSNLIGDVFTINMWLTVKPSNKTLYFWARCPNQDRYATFGLPLVSGTLQVDANQVTNNGAEVFNTALTLAGMNAGDMLTFVANWPSFDVYQNGVHIGTTITFTTQHFNNAFSGGESLSIGRAGAFNNYYFDGAFDDISYFSRVLTPTEISNLYKQSSFLDMF
jgi:hypothetical protein